MRVYVLPSFVTIQINTALKPSELPRNCEKCFVTIQINTALKPSSELIGTGMRFVTIQINTALKRYRLLPHLDTSFVTIQINTALKPRRRFRNRAACLSQTTDLNDLLYFYKFLIIIKSSSRVYCG